MKPSRILKTILRNSTVVIVLLLFAENISAQDNSSINTTNTVKEFPNIMSYEGYITDSKGMPLPDGSYNFTFSLYSTLTNGSAIWSEEHQSVQVKNGNVQLTLGKGTSPNPLNIPFDTQYYLGIKFGNNPEMSPRLELTTSGYSFRAKVADGVVDGSISTDKLAAGAVTNEKIESVSWNKITGAPTDKTQLGYNAAQGTWLTTGNENTNPAEEFIGTKDDRALMFRTNNKMQLSIQKNGNLIITNNIEMDDDNWIGVYHDVLPQDPDVTGHERIFFDDDDSDIEIMGADVGIGKGAESPEAKLHVKGHGEIQREHIVLFENSDNEDGFAMTKMQDVGLGIEIPEAKIHIKGKGDIQRQHIVLFENSDNEDGFAMTNAQDIGLGTEIPEAKLHIKGKGDIQKQHIALFENNESENEIGLAITNQEDIGIGTENPETKFHVKSTGRFGGGGEENHVALFENTESGDGIAIKVNNSVPSSDNNFITFYANNNEPVGCIEGQTIGEFYKSWDFIWTTVMFAVDETITIGAAIVAYNEVPPDKWSGGFGVAQAASQLAQHLEWWITTARAVGTSFSSGGADFAEYLVRLNSEEIIQPGDIVGVYGGKVTKNTKDAQQLMIISTMPIVLGNRPPSGSEYLCEKVAFIGQVPVKVRGLVNSGDYIIPSGLDDGTGIAVSPELMTIEDYAKVVAKAWSTSPNPDLGVVTAVVGLTQGDIAMFVKKQTNELQATKMELNILKKDFAAMRNEVEKAVRQITQKNEPSVITVQK